MSELSLGVVGAGGRMGRAMIRAIAATPGVKLHGAAERPGSELIGKDAGTIAGIEALGILVRDDPAAAFGGAAVIDFTSPVTIEAHAAAATAHRGAWVVGTTGLDPASLKRLRAAAETIAVVNAANFSVGVTLLRALARRAATVLGAEYDAEIVEMHHRAKVDAPSGTALALGHAVADGRGVKLEDVWVKSRDGITGPRPDGAIGFAALRGGDIVGDHDVHFAGIGERLTLTHRATNREVFAQGAVRAAVWAARQRPGLYDMDDVLGLKEV